MKNPAVAVLTPEIIKFKQRSYKEDKEGCNIIIKRSILEENITIVNICAFNIGASTCIKQLLMNIKGEIHSTAIVGGYNTLLTSMNMSGKQKFNKDIMSLSIILKQMVLIYIYETFYPKAAEYIFSFQVHMRHSPGKMTHYGTKHIL